MKKKMGALAILVAFSLSIQLVSHVWGKGHVPAGKAQMCHKGRVIQIAEESVADHIGHGDCRINAAELVPPLFTRDACDPDELGDFCS